MTPNRNPKIKNYQKSEKIKKNFLQKFETRLYIENVLNTEYRNYLNRLRFFAAEPGRLIGLELSYRF